MKIIGAGLIVKEKRILMIKRSKDKPINSNPNYWSFPGGRHENNETFEATAIREVKEEVGLDFKITTLFKENQTEHNHYYVFLGDFSGKIILQEEECDGYAWYTYEETKYLLTNERIKLLLEELHREELI